jgi:hypothetical protein
MASATPRRILASHVAPRALAPRTRLALEGLGYRLVAAVTRGPWDDASWRPDARLVDERHLGRLAAAEADPVPIVLLRAGPPRAGLDPRVVGHVPQPAEVGALYPLLQAALEPTPRRSPRAPAHLQARCTQADRRWTAEVVALSETGCLLRSVAEPGAGTALNLLFPLPLGRMVSTRAEVVVRFDAAVGLSFRGTAPEARRAIAEYVERRLASL